MQNMQNDTTTGWVDAFLERAETRLGFIKAFGAAGLAAAAASALPPREAEAQASSDADLLNLLLPVEVFEAEVFYPAALNAGILSGAALAVVQQLVNIESVHRDALKGAITSLGGTPAPPPKFFVPPAILADQTTFLGAALQQEITDVGANLTLGPLIQSPDILAAGGAIEGQEGENVVAVKNLLGVVPPANEPFPQPVSLQQAQAALAQFVVGGLPALLAGAPPSFGGGGPGAAPPPAAPQLPKTAGPGYNGK